MSSRNQYKALLTSIKQELRTAKKFINEQNDEIAQLLKRRDELFKEHSLLTLELRRIRSRKWWQFWKFLKRNRIIQ